MTIYRPELLKGSDISNFSLKITHPQHLVSKSMDFNTIGKNISELGEKIGSEAVTRSGKFEDFMLRAMDKVSGDQQFASRLEQQAVTDPDSVDIHDITIAQAKASMSLNIARNVLSRVVQGWRDLINTR
ncbi:MAG: flagellar hook-basal body complex protein FliE [Treponema sp.]|jgi:flagellar hook-basal body complex protein FliE|nr:flagellar hook-basal body complex protein FliE [Treponema sp.]